MSVELKIKAKHLAAEAKIIKKEEKIQLERKRKNKSNAYFSIIEHRKTVLRDEARATHLARAFISNKTYETVECDTHDRHRLVHEILPRVIKLVIKYKPRHLHNMNKDDIKEILRQWIFPHKDQGEFIKWYYRWE